MTPTRISRERAAELLGVGTSRLRALARLHPTQLGCRIDEATGVRTYDEAEVRALATKRGTVLPESRLTRRAAAALLGVGIDRFNQLVRDDHPKRLGHKRTTLGRATYSRAAVEALKRRREGNRAPVYPRRGSRLPEALRGQQ
jgi:hypothetical protein